MGLSSRRPILPAPTESLVDSTAEETGVSEDIETDVSRRTDRTSATIPDDGSPVTITTGQKAKTYKFTNTKNSSQASLLIEYYEGVKDTETGRRPSLRVRVRPSAGAKSREITGDGHIVVTQESGSRKVSSSHRVPLNSKSLHAHAATESVSSVEDLDTTPRAGPIDIEIGGQGSDLSRLSASPEPRYTALESDVSSMPADSILGFRAPEIRVAPAMASSVPIQSQFHGDNELKPPMFKQERNPSHERITQKAIEKLSSKERASSKSSRHHSDRSRSRSGTVEVIGSSQGERRRKSGKLYGEESSISTNTEPSQISNSLLSVGAKSFDQQSVRSGASSITNPKLLQTVEDAIRRLILPELKEIKRNGSQRTRAKEEEYSDISENSIAREKEASRRVSSGSRSKKRISKESSGSTSRRRERSYRDEYDSRSDISSPRKGSVSSVSEHHHRSNEKDHRSRDVAAGALAGTALTAAALHHQDSSSTLERRRRRKRSKSRSSRSRSASINESEQIFEKHAVPPMPFRSEVGSEMTRSSLLSSNTASTATPTQREVREVIRGSPLQASSPAQTPRRGSGDLRQTFGTHHNNFSEHNLATGRPSYEEHSESLGSPDARGHSPEMGRQTPSSPGFLADPERLRQYERNLHQQHPIRRGLSPIQSVASYATTEPNRNSMMHARSIDSIASMKKRQQALREEVSIDSFSSATPDLKKHNRPQGINLENRSEILGQHEEELDQLDEEDDEFYEEQHSQNNRYRESFASSDDRRLTDYTDDALDTPQLDKMTASQHVAKGFAANPEYGYPHSGVESAVASLVEPSVLDLPESPQRSSVGTAYDNKSAHSEPRHVEEAKSISPFKQEAAMHSHGSFGKSRQVDHSPPQSPAHSFEEHQEEILHVEHNETKAIDSPESDITTNPSVIQGHIGLTSPSRDQWTYVPTPDRTIQSLPEQTALSRDLPMHAPDLIPEALNVSQRNTYTKKADLYPTVAQSPIQAVVKDKDEGYDTDPRDNPKSLGLYSKQNDQAYDLEDTELRREEDPFLSKRDPYLSGLSHGMAPFYDSATGKSIDRIQSKDIVALMDHLTVRDAQRNARDTEILITLVRSAAEMRNSFEEMKKFIAEQDGIIMDVAEQQHEKTQKVIGGPRPQPSSRSQQRSLASQDDLPTKRRNIFKRALQGLGSKNAMELQNIEGMLMQLLDDVEGLRMNQVGQSGSLGNAVEHNRSTSYNSVENTRALTGNAYEPEGRTGPALPGKDHISPQSGGSPRRTEYLITNERKSSDNRVDSGKEIHDEDYNDYDDHDDDVDHDDRTPRASPNAEAQYRQSRGQSAPVETPLKMHDRLSGPWSNDATPQYAPDPGSSGKKHKSITSSIFGKGFISRWSKTTASSVQEPRYSGQVKNQPYSHVSRSGSDLGDYAYEPEPGDRFRSNTSLQDEHYGDQENRPPSPLVPSQVSEGPKYQGYRNSQNLQHPQPRQGPTSRYQNKLETEAISYHDQFSPTSQTSSQWENQGGVSTRNPNQILQYVPQAPLSPISDAGYSEISERSAGSSRRGTRQQKIMDDEPLVPQRPAKMPMSPNYVDHVTAARAGSPAYDKSPVNALRSPQGSGRKPSGPRPLSSTGQNGKPVSGDMNTVKKTRFRGSPYHIEN